MKELPHTASGNGHDLATGHGSRIENRGAEGTGLALVAASVILSAAIQSVAKLLLQSINALYLLFMGQVVAAAFMAFLYGLVRSLPELRQLGSGRLLVFALVTLLGGFAGPLLLFEGLKSTTATNAVLIGRAESVLTLVAGAQLLGERVARYQWLGAGLVLLGSVLVMGVGGGELSIGIGRGDFLVFASAIAWSAGTVFYRAFLRDAPVKIVVLFRNLLGATMCLAFGLILFGPKHLSTVFQVEQLLYVIVYAVLIMTVSQLFWYSGIARVAVSRAAALTLATPALGIAFAVLLLGETISAGQIAGGTVIIVGMAMALRGLPTEDGRRETFQLRWPS